MSLDVPLASVHFIWALGAISQLKRIPFAAELVAQQFPPPHSSTTLLQAAEALGLKAKRHASAANEIQRVPLPCLALLKSATPGSAGTGAAETQAQSIQTGKKTPHALALVVEADADRVVMLEPGAALGATLSTADFKLRYAGELILFSQQPKPPSDADAASERKKSFGFSWFVPELLRHKRIWRDVLLASLMIQTIALFTPLLTQIVIDRVIAHQTLNTLIVIGVALAVCLVFNAGMSWLRQPHRERARPARAAIQHFQPQGDDQPSRQAHRANNVELSPATSE